MTKKQKVEEENPVSCFYEGSVRLDLNTGGSDMNICAVELPAITPVEVMRVSVEDHIATFKMVFPGCLTRGTAGDRMKEEVAMWLMNASIGVLSLKVVSKFMGPNGVLVC